MYLVYYGYNLGRNLVICKDVFFELPITDLNTGFVIGSVGLFFLIWLNFVLVCL